VSSGRKASIPAKINTAKSISRPSNSCHSLPNQHSSFVNQTPAAASAFDGLTIDELRFLIFDLIESPAAIRGSGAAHEDGNQSADLRVPEVR
jgi:hypothetical protein